MQRWHRKVNVSSLIAAVFAVNGFLNLVTGLLPILRVGARVGVEELPDYLRVTPAQQLSGVVSMFLGVVMSAEVYAPTARNPAMPKFRRPV